MKTARVRLAARIAAVESFREESERQRLAVARHAAQEAAVDCQVAEFAWCDVASTRADALGVRHDLARYLTWGDLAVEASRIHEQAARQAELAHDHADECASAWAAVKVRADATDERAMKIARAATHDDLERQHAERMDLWLNRWRRPV